MKTLVLDTSGNVARAGLVADGAVLRDIAADAGHGLAERIPSLVAEALGDERPDRIVAVTGPGSFTGLRAGLAFAQGFADARSLPLLGVSLDAALREEAGALDGRLLWTVLDTKRGTVYLHDGAGWRSLAAEDLPRPEHPIAIAGDAAILAAATLAARGADIRLTDARRPGARAIASAADSLAVTPALPVYVDPPAARPAAARPAPA